MDQQYSDFDGANDGDTGGAQNGPKQLREAYERKAAEAKEAREQAEKVAREFAEYKAAQREKEVDSFIKEKNLPEKAKTLIGDRDPGEWFEEFGDMFASSSTDNSNTEGQATAQQQQPPRQLTPQEAALAGVTSVQPGQFTPNAGAEMEAKLDQIFEAPKSEDDILAQMKDLGAW